MAVKTITIDMEAYRRLRGVKRREESFSQTIKRVVQAPADLDALFARLAADPLSDQAVKAIEKQVRRRVASRRMN